MPTDAEQTTPDIVTRLRDPMAPFNPDVADAADEIERLREAMRLALDEIEDAGPKALKYAAQELRKGLGQ